MGFHWQAEMATFAVCANQSDPYGYATCQDGKARSTHANHPLLKGFRPCNGPFLVHNQSVTLTLCHHGCACGCAGGQTNTIDLYQCTCPDKPAADPASCPDACPNINRYRNVVPSYQARATVGSEVTREAPEALADSSSIDSAVLRSCERA